MSQRKSFALSEKLSIILELESGVSRKDVSEQRGIPYSTLTLMWSKREEIKTAASRIDVNKNFKRMRDSNFDDLDIALLRWLKQQRANNDNVSGTVLQLKANELAKLLSLEDFHCNKSWVDRFKKRHNISFDKKRKTMEIVATVKPERTDEESNTEDESLPEVTVEEAEYHINEIIRYFYGKINKEKLEQLNALKKLVLEQKILNNRQQETYRSPS